VTTSAPSLPVRFELRTGRMGSYFYDTRTQTDVDLVQTLKYLNAYAEYTDADIEAMLDGLEGKGVDHPHMETLAATQHAIWSHWMTYCLPLMVVKDVNNYNRWVRQMTTPYGNLTEAEQESDRKIVRQFILGEESQ